MKISHLLVANCLSYAVLLATGCSNGSVKSNTDASYNSNSPEDDASVNDVDAGSDLGQACPGPTVANCPANVPSFSRQVTQIVETRCAVCHSVNNDAGLWTLSDWQSLSDWQYSILQDIRGCTQPPPASGVLLALAERKAIEGWLACGAPDN